MNIKPVIVSTDTKIFPVSFIGVKSPYPSVVIVTEEKYTASSGFLIGTLHASPIAPVYRYNAANPII